MTIGILALQGDFAEHGAVLRKLGVNVCEVRTSEDLSDDLQGLILPGGESTVIGRFLAEEGISTAIRRRRMPLLGTCAGGILLAKEVTGKNAPPTLALLDVTIERNSYGNQCESFAAEIDVRGCGRKRVSFIRAPRIARVGRGVEVLALHEGTPVLVRSRDVIAATFHTEVWGDAWLHRLWIEHAVSHAAFDSLTMGTSLHESKT